VLGALLWSFTPFEAVAEPKQAWYSESRDLYYDLPVRVSYFPADEALSRRVWHYLEQADAQFNDYRADSEIAKINALSSPQEVTLSPALADAFGKSKKAYGYSHGLFDITSAPIRNLWKAGAEQGRLPSTEEVAAVQQRCGFQKVELEGRQLRLTQVGMQFDFGGIIKGILIDQVMEMLKAGGATSALVQISGETAAFGPSPKKRPYRIAVPNPHDTGQVWCVIHGPKGELSGSTSGNYEMPISIGGEKYYHIFDPRTGKPAPTAVASVSVVFPETGKNWMADSLTTTGVLLGPEETIRMVESFGGEALFIIWENGVLKEVKSTGWDRFQL